MNAQRMKHALQGTLFVSLCGAIFSGVLTYREVFATTALACPSPGAPGTLLGYPACVYGFFMYCILAGASIFGLTGARSGNLATRESTAAAETTDTTLNPLTGSMRGESPAHRA